MADQWFSGNRCGFESIGSPANFEFGDLKNETKEVGVKLERLNETGKDGVMKYKQVEKLIRILSENQQMLAGKIKWLEEIGE
jgi:archaellum component FlaC